MIHVPTLFEGNFSIQDPVRLETAQVKQNKWSSILEKIWNVTKIILVGLIGVAMFATNPTLFAIGFIAGVIWDKKVQEIVEKVKGIWKSQPWSVLILTGIASFLALQVTWAAGSVLFAANLGCQMAKRAQEYIYERG